MQKSKIYVDPFVLNKISESNKLTDKEKVSFLKYIYYMTESEREDLAQLV